VNIKLYPYQLEFVFPFRIAHGTRTHTDALFIELESDGVRVFGEATFPPYLTYTMEAAIDSLSKVDLSVLVTAAGGIIDPRESLLPYQSMEPPALAALDMALWSLKAKSEETTIGALLGITEVFATPRIYTISVCEKDEMSMRLGHGRSKGFSFFKLKLDGVHDRQMLSDYRTLSNAPFAIDANQAWTDTGYALEISKELERQGCVLIEQPFHKDDLVNTQNLSVQLSIPVIADEACQRYEDIDRVKGHFSGINVKLQKCGGISPAYKMITYARSLGLKVLIGCMSESIIGCSVGEVLSPLCDWNDLDGNYLVKEVPYSNQ
jgi:L-alanine-DL-glutamate epimerase-like enolase superfamily enzyme